MKNLFVPTKENNYKPYLLRKVALVAYSFLLVFVNSFGGVLGIDKVSASNITPENIIKLANQERASAGLNTLNVDSRLSAAALAKANNMFAEQYWDHFGPNGETPWQFIRAAGYDYVYAGENLAKGFQTAEGVHEAWMASPTHAANIMSVNYKDIGVAVVQGELLGKQTTLVVEMFGNLTQDIDSVASSSGTQTSSSGNNVTGSEEGDIKSIMITSPADSSVVMDPGTSIKGEVQNVDGQYTVEVYDQSQSVGETTSSNSNWEFKKGSDWSEGSHTLEAEIKENTVYSNMVNFTVDSTAPVIDKSSVTVKKADNTYALSFKIDDTWADLRIVNGNSIIPITSADKTNIEVQIPVKGIGDKIVIIAADSVGNISELDISEYFKDSTTQGNGIVLSLKNSSVGDDISIAIVSLVFILLCVEVFVYWKRGKLRDITGDVFTIGAWWLILSIAVFNGFTGLIS
jgi:hypothetical protein